MIVSQKNLFQKVKNLKQIFVKAPIMSQKYLRIQQSPPLEGTTLVNGAKNAALVIIASLIMTKGNSTLRNVPNNSDVRHMIQLLKNLGASIEFDSKAKILSVDTTNISHFEVCPDIMNKMRASILVMGPLLSRFGTAKVALPGGCSIGARPINYHLQGFKSMGVIISEEAPYLVAQHKSTSKPLRITLEYPSVGATENLMMFACSQEHETLIINAALEPEVLNLIDALKKMGADISIQQGLFILIRGGKALKAISHEIIPDRLEAGTLLLAAAATKGSIHLANARADHMDLFLEKLKEIGHTILVGTNPSKENPLTGIKIFAAETPKGISIKTAPYPGFPTDLQAPTMASLCIARGNSSFEETVFENRFIHLRW